MNKISIVIIALLSFNASLFSKSGLELGFFVPIGMGISIHSYDDSQYSNNSAFNRYAENNPRKTKLGFEFGVLAQAGYKFEINKNFSFSILGEFGYARDSLNYAMNDGDSNSYLFVTKNNIYYSLDGLSIGVMPKLNYKNMSFCLGFGVKIPLYAEINYSSENRSIGYVSENITMIKSKAMKNYFKYQAVPFIKFVFDYSVYNFGKCSLVLSGYFNYDFNLLYQDKNIKSSVNPMEKLSSVDLGIQIGVKIRPTD